MPASQPSQPGSCPLQRDRGAIGPTVPLSQTSQISQIGRSAYLARPQAWDEGEGAQGGPGGIELEPRGSRGKLFAQEPASETGHSARTHGPGWPGVLDEDASCRMQFFLSHATVMPYSMIPPSLPLFQAAQAASHRRHESRDSNRAHALRISYCTVIYEQGR
jgi:hypothetical protein